MMSPVQTVSMYMPSVSATVAKLGIPRMLPITRNRIPTGEYLHEKDNSVITMYLPAWETT